MDCGFRIIVLTRSGGSEVVGGFLHRKERSVNRSWSSFLHLRGSNNRRGTRDFVWAGI